MQRLAHPIATFTLALAGLAGSAAAQLPPVPIPAGNPQTPEKIILGKILFFEEQLGRTNAVACATCHMPEVGGGDPRTFTPQNRHPGFDGVFGTADDVRGSRGVVRCSPTGRLVDDGVFFPLAQVTGRKAPPAVGAGWDPVTFWDGRAGPRFDDPAGGATILATGGALEAQAALPPLAGEMGCDGTHWGELSLKIQAARPLRLASSIPADIQAALAQDPTYPDLFEAAFGDPAVTAARIPMAIAAYERTLVPDQTPWDAFVAGDTTALTPDQQLGLQVFEQHCAVCHPSPLFTDHDFHNVGVRPGIEDIGREGVTNNIADRGKFKTPGLRNIGLRAPYFHNGGMDSLLDVVLFYDRGGDFADNLDPLIQPLGLSWLEINALVDFLENGLTDPRAAQNLPPFDRPVLFSEQAANPATYGTRKAGEGGFAPRYVAPTPPMLGSDRFTLGVAKGYGGALALFALDLAPAPAGTLFRGIPLHVAFGPGTAVLPLPLDGGAPNTPGDGYTSAVIDIPDDPALNGLTLYSQWLVIDPSGVCSTEGISFTLTRP